MSPSTRPAGSGLAVSDGLLETLTAVLPWSLRDMSLALGAVGPAPTGLTHGGALWRGQRGRFWFEIPEVARYLVEDGERLTIEPLAGAEPREVARYAAATPSAAAFLQRGLPVLHAAVAIGPQGAVVLAGDSSIGKSVLLASLVARGWQMLSDDMAALSIAEDGAFWVLAGSGDMHLWPDAAARVAVADPADAMAEPVKLSRVWLLGTTNEPDVKITALAGFTRFRALTCAAYNSRIAAALLDPGANMEVLGGLAGSDVPIRSLNRPRVGWTADELADTVIGDVLGDVLGDDAGDVVSWEE